MIPSEDVEEDEENVLEKIKAEAEAAMSTVSKAEITEIKSLANPPLIVKDLMHCVAVTLGKRYRCKKKKFVQVIKISAIQSDLRAPHNRDSGCMEFLHLH